MEGTVTQKTAGKKKKVLKKRKKTKAPKQEYRLTAKQLLALNKKVRQGSADASARPASAITIEDLQKFTMDQINLAEQEEQAEKEAAPLIVIKKIPLQDPPRPRTSAGIPAASSKTSNETKKIANYAIPNYGNAKSDYSPPIIDLEVRKIIEKFKQKKRAMLIKAGKLHEDQSVSNSTPAETTAKSDSEKPLKSKHDLYSVDIADDEEADEPQDVKEADARIASAGKMIAKAAVTRGKDSPLASASVSATRPDENPKSPEDQVKKSTDLFDSLLNRDSPDIQNTLDAAAGGKKSKKSKHKKSSKKSKKASESESEQSATEDDHELVVAKLDDAPVPVIEPEKVEEPKAPEATVKASKKSKKGKKEKNLQSLNEIEEYAEAVPEKTEVKEKEKETLKKAVKDEPKEQDKKSASKNALVDEVPAAATEKGEPVASKKSHKSKKAVVDETPAKPAVEEKPIPIPSNPVAAPIPSPPKTPAILPPPVAVPPAASPTRPKYTDPKIPDELRKILNSSWFPGLFDKPPSVKNIVDISVSVLNDGKQQDKIEAITSLLKIYRAHKKDINNPGLEVIQPQLIAMYDESWEVRGHACLEIAKYNIPDSDLISVLISRLGDVSDTVR